MSKPVDTARTVPEHEGESLLSHKKALLGAAPSHIGRYRIEKLLGEGSFGGVYLAHDEQLQRWVAVKMPHLYLVTRPEDAHVYLAEARTVAKLDHPHIVPVYDFGSTPECPCFIVSKYIEGCTLKERMAQQRPSFRETAEIVVAIAEALHYAHHRGFVHRDIKPSNILVDTNSHPYVVDFGLALREEDVGHGPRYAGTPAYMSPEQARGEGHRVDGRSDIFSLGVILYELLTGRRPFRADSREELLEQITSMEVRPPRQIDDQVPKELERICLKALAKRASERYTTAWDLADDLRYYLHALTQQDPGRSTLSDAGALPAMPPELAPAHAPVLTPATPSSLARAPVIPKGLRPFDEHDEDFFLELLPGPRDRHGLPDSIRFWKTRIEDRSPAGTFPVGLLYGSSGCGKSSLVRAGLLPRLAAHVICVYVEATPDETEARLLRSLRAYCPLANKDWGLKETLTMLRRGVALPTGKKVLLILDQFEQWLHARHDLHQTELTAALRQCDGHQLQGLILVRDDFYLGANRLFQELDVPLQEGANAAMVDLFDTNHARKVLIAFGRAYGRLPEVTSALSSEQQSFLAQSLAGLADRGKIAGVRLALFAEMMKSHPWTPQSLHAVGGTAGVGVTFLEETFTTTTAPPAHRRHERAARAVLRALLPDAGSNIKGQMQPVATLLERSGYTNQRADFDNLLRLLDGELRLITPTDPEGHDEDGRTGAEEGAEHPATRSAQYYQLTHDFLVPAVREWLTQKQRETPAGRAHLLLADRAALWTAKPEAKQLPSLLEWLSIVGRTDRRQWSEAQGKLMRIASRRHLGRLALGLAAFLAVAILLTGLYGLWRQQRQEELAKRLVDQLLVSEVTRVAEVAEQLEQLPGGWPARLEHLVAEASSSPAERLRAHLVLVRDHPDSIPFLIERLLQSGPLEFSVILQALEPYKAQLREVLWSVAANPQRASSPRFHAAVALAELDPENERWADIAGPTAGALVRVDLLTAPDWTRLLRPAREQLLKPLTAEFHELRAPASQRSLSTSILADYASDRPELLARLLQDADPAQFQTLFPAVQAQAPRCVACFETALTVRTEPAESELYAQTRRRANSAVALFLLDRPQAVSTFLAGKDDPDVRTALLDLLPQLVEQDVLWALRERLTQEVGRQAVLLALEGYHASGRLAPAEQGRLEAELCAILRHDESAAVHSAAEWLLRRLAGSRRANDLIDSLAGKQRGGWRVSPTGHTLALIRGPVEFAIGSPPQEPRRDDLEDRSPRRIAYHYEIGTHEVTVAQFQKLFPDHRYASDVAPTPDCPINYVSWYDVARYCRRLSEVEGIAEKDMIFPPVEQIHPDRELSLPADWLQRAGYRWPTEAEWEYACRGGTTTPRFFGRLPDALPNYSWWHANAQERCWPVGSLRPNPFGLFDVLGNVGEWCFDRKGPYAQALSPEEEAARKNRPGEMRVFRGGSFQQMAKDLRAAKRNTAVPSAGFSFHGFRIARTVPVPPP